VLARGEKGKKSYYKKGRLMSVGGEMRANTPITIKVQERLSRSRYIIPGVIRMEGPKKEDNEEKKELGQKRWVAWKYGIFTLLVAKLNATGF